MARFNRYVGVDWASQEHQICVLDEEGNAVSSFKVRHDGEALSRFADRLVSEGRGELGSVAVAIEMTSDAVIEVLLERGVAVYAINPKQVDRFRDRHSMSGAKDDRRDAFVLADALRTDLRLFRKLEIGNPTLVELREISRARAAFVDDYRAVGSRLWAVLHRYHAAFLELGSIYEDPWLLDLLELVPTPAAVRHLKRSRVELLLKRHHIRRLDAQQVLDTLRKKPLPVAPGVVEAASAHALLLLKMLRVVIEQRDQAADRIGELLQQLDAPSDGSRQTKKHRDADIILSLPGAGEIISATMLAEATNALANRDYQALRVRTGVAPVTRQTGKQKPQHSMRRSCNVRLRTAMHIWVGGAVKKDPRLASLYRRLRAGSQSVGRARRGVADRLLAMLVSMLKNDQLYDPARRTSAGSPEGLALASA